MMGKRIETVAFVMLMAALFAASSGITVAYLTDTPVQLTNLITPGEVSVKLTEPAWDEEKAQKLLPDTKVPKNPVLENTGKIDAWMFLKISVPVRNIRLVDDQNNKKQNPVSVPLFHFTAEQSWELIEKSETEEANTYIFGYRELVRPGEITRPVFENVTLVNYLEGELTEKEKLEMPIKAMALQKNVSEDETDIARIYEIYLEQEERGLKDEK
ncbi:MAG: hypothetical protein Q4F83_08810 [Eubacteriales bacterium]|nr:hypothetical protein [Eubacteriales bacterium]